MICFVLTFSRLSSFRGSIFSGARHGGACGTVVRLGNGSAGELLDGLQLIVFRIFVAQKKLASC